MWLKEYFTFTKKERIGIYTLLSLIVILQAAKFFIPYLHPKKQYDDSAFRKEIAELKIISADSSKERTYYTTNNYQKNYRSSYRNYDNDGGEIKGELFSFDPNTLEDAGWKRLGLRDKTIQTIRNFVSKGGKFYKADDIKKIWGLHEDEIERLLPYVSIQNSFEKRKDSSKFHDFEKPKYPPREKSFVDVNSGDSSAYETLPGIGPKLASRIITFRNRLGGFTSVEQVGETYGLPDSTFQKIKPLLKIDGSDIKQISVNEATLEELKVHPYVRYHLANAIVEYRKQHGNYKSLGDLKRIMIMTGEIFEKVKPYLKL